jgi:hypothetical protein
MRTLTLAYRDNDRTPVIFAIREMAKSRYNLDVRVVQIKGTEAFEAALFDGSCDVIIEHLEYLYQEAAKGKKITMFCAPSQGGGLHLVVPQHVQSVEEFKGGIMAVRSSGRPYTISLWLRMMGLEKDVATVIVDDGEVGRWGQWKKVLSGDCIATFMSPLYLPDALAAGLKTLSVPEIPVIGHFAQACLSKFPKEQPVLFTDYVKSVLHALAWLIRRPAEALATLAPELKGCMKLQNDAELKRLFESVISGLKTKPYPTPEGIANTYEIAALEYPGAKGLNPLALWDLHWVKELDEDGFIDAIAP